MKQFLLICLLLNTGFLTMAQSSKQVKWSFTAKKVADKTYEVHMVADINPNWHMYAQDAGDGPQSTAFNFTKNPLLSFDGNIKEIGKMKKVYEDAFKSEVRFYEKNVSFVQTVKVKGSAKTNLAGKVEFMVCDDKQCLPPTEVPFAVNIGG
jgi:endo-beta-N-acetylglucosaminidase D